MQLAKTLGLTAALAASFATPQAHAVLIGTPGAGPAFSQPFGANPGGLYQQIYARELFTEGSIRITSLSFFTSAAPAAPLGAGTYTLSLSSTARGLDGLEDGRLTAETPALTVFNSNLGADNTVVFSGALPAVANGRLTFALTSAFNYNPNVSELLLDVRSTASNTPAVFFRATGDGVEPVSRLVVTGSGATAQQFGLVTEIVGVPEPVSAALLGAGLLGLAGLRRRGA